MYCALSFLLSETLLPKVTTFAQLAPGLVFHVFKTTTYGSTKKEKKTFLSLKFSEHLQK